MLKTVICSWFMFCQLIASQGNIIPKTKMHLTNSNFPKNVRREKNKLVTAGIFS